MREPRSENVNVHDVAFFHHIKRQRLICGALLHMASILHVPFLRTELPLGASIVCDRIVQFPLYLRDGESKHQPTVLVYCKCGLADAASKCSCILSAVGHLGYCRFQQMMRDVRASSGGKWYREVIYWLSLFNHRDNKCCFIPFTLTIKLCALASSPPSVSCSLSFIKYWWAPSYGHYWHTRTPEIIGVFICGKGLWRVRAALQVCGSGLCPGTTKCRQRQSVCRFFFFSQIILSLSV